MANDIYFNARAKAKENEILSLEQLGELINAKSLDDLTRLLNEYRLLQGISIEKYGDLKAIIKREEEELLHFLKKNSPNTDLAKFFLIKFDYLNLETAYLQINLNKQDLNYTYQGELRIDTIKYCIQNKKYESFSKYMQDCLKKLDKMLEENKLTGFWLDSIIKQALYLEQFTLSKVNKQLHEYMQIFVDLKNIYMALLLRDFKLFENLKLNGGSLTSKFLEKLCTDDYDKILKDSKISSYNIPIKMIIESKKKGELATKFEFLLDCLALTHFDEFRYSAVGNIPYIRYSFLKLNEIVNLRIIFEGLNIGRNKKKIYNEIRRVYAD